MPKLNWHPSENGGWFARDGQGNHWYLTENLERVTITTPDGVTVNGWNPKVAWKALQEVG